MQNRIAANSFLPATVVLEMTYKCNHKCIFCSCPWENDTGRFIKKPELTTNQWKNLLTKLCAMGVSNIVFTGGEALLRKDLSDLIHYAASCVCDHVESVDGSLVLQRKPPSLYLLSNGRVVTPSVIRMCKKLNIQLSMSLPGLQTFKQHTGFDSADKVLRMFTFAKDNGLKTIANITVTKVNLPEIERVIAAALLAGAEQILLNRFLPGGRGLKYQDELSLSVNELTKMLDTAERVLTAAHRFGSLGTEVPLCTIDPSRYKRLQVGTQCSAAKQFFVIGPSGYVRVCNHSPVELNHIDDLSFLKSNDYWNTFTQSKYIPHMCNGCYQRNKCDGGCREAAHITGGEVCSPDMLLL